MCVCRLVAFPKPRAAISRTTEYILQQLSTFIIILASHLLQVGDMWAHLPTRQHYTTINSHIFSPNSVSYPVVHEMLNQWSIPAFDSGQAGTLIWASWAFCPAHGLDNPISRLFVRAPPPKKRRKKDSRQSNLPPFRESHPQKKEEEENKKRRKQKSAARARAPTPFCGTCWPTSRGSPSARWRPASCARRALGRQIWAPTGGVSPVDTVDGQNPLRHPRRNPGMIRFP